jgi:hypothetical protein
MCMHMCILVSSRILRHDLGNKPVFIKWGCHSWYPVNQHSSIIVVVGRYPTIPLEMFTGIVYHQWITQCEVSRGRRSPGEVGPGSTL